MPSFRQIKKEKQPPQSSKETRIKRELLRKFNKQAFINYVEKHVDFGQGEVPRGRVEQVIVNFFNIFIFNGKEFQHIPEFEKAIFELLHKHEEQLARFTYIDGRNNLSGLSTENKTKFLILAYPSYRKDLDLSENIFNYCVFLDKEMKKIRNKIKRAWRRAKEK